jgi:hypothetical protein
LPSLFALGFRDYQAARISCPPFILVRGFQGGVEPHELQDAARIFNVGDVPRKEGVNRIARLIEFQLL